LFKEELFKEEVFKEEVFKDEEDEQRVLVVLAVKYISQFPVLF
jgi:hypothetical protein